MAIGVEELLLLAKELATHDQEVYWRSAVSRAYYCTYHECQLVGKQLPEAPYAADPKGIHDRFIKKFTTYAGQNDAARKIRAIGYILANFKELRTAADYDIASDFQHAAADEAFQYVENIRKKL